MGLALSRPYVKGTVVNGHGGIDPNWLQQQFPALAGIAPLNVGGQKQVFAATHHTDGPVVLKLIHPRQDTETTRREILAVNQLAGSRVPQIFETGTLNTQVGPLFWFREHESLAQRFGNNFAMDLLPSGKFSSLENKSSNVCSPPQMFILFIAMLSQKISSVTRKVTFG